MAQPKCDMKAGPNSFHSIGLLRNGRGGGGGGGGVGVFLCFFSCSLTFFIENITGRLYNIQNSKLCFRDMKIMSLRNGGDFGKQLVLRTRCLPNHHHSFVT